MSAPDLIRGVRASDDERDRIAKLLQRAAAEGRLSPEEAGERLAAASTATYREDLQELVADLPMEDRRDRPSRAPWMVWGVARFALVATLFLTLWGFWGVRMFLWPLVFMAMAFFLRPWSRRRWRMEAWRRSRPSSARG